MSADTRPLGRPIKGPSALGGDPRRFLMLTRTLAVMDFKLRFFGSALGYLWQLMRPLMLFAVLYVVFTQLVRFGGGQQTPFFAVVLLTGIVIFTFFSEATGGAVTSVVDRENLVRKIHFPRLVVPLSVVLRASFSLVLNFVVVAVFVFGSGVRPRLSWLELPLLLLIVAALATGLATLLSALYVRFRDMRPIWDVLLQVVFYGSPILYVVELIPSERYQHLLLMGNPLAAVLQQTRHAVIDPQAASAAEAIGGWERLLVPGGIVLAVLVLGLWVFNREAPRIAENL